MKGSHVLWWERQYIYRKVNYVRYTENGVAAVILCIKGGDFVHQFYNLSSGVCSQSLVNRNQLTNLERCFSYLWWKKFCSWIHNEIQLLSIFFFSDLLLFKGDKIFWWENVLTKFMTLSRLRLDFIHCVFNI